MQVPPEQKGVAPPHTVPKTSSGKIRRAASRELYEQGRIGAHAASVGWQLARLAGAGLRARAAGALRRVGEILYALRFWGVCALAVLLPLWPLLVLTNPDIQPLSVRLPTIQSQTQLGVFLAAMFIACLVPVAGFLLFQRSFLRGNGLGGAIKG